MSRTHGDALIKAKASPGYDPEWASATAHKRDAWPAPDRRSKCHCGCKGRATHVGGANGLGLTSGCELSVRRWVRDGFDCQPLTDPKGVPCPTCEAAPGRSCRTASGQRAKHCHIRRWEVSR